MACNKSLEVYILRLLAGKSRPVCTEFPLATFSAKKFNEASFKNSRQTIIQQHLVQKELKSNRQFLFCYSKKVSKQSEMFRFFEEKFRRDMFILTPFF